MQKNRESSLFSSKRMGRMVKAKAGRLRRKRLAMRYDWSKVDWKRQDMEIAAGTGATRERVRQKRKELFQVRLDAVRLFYQAGKGQRRAEMVNLELPSLEVEARLQGEELDLLRRLYQVIPSHRRRHLNSSLQQIRRMDVRGLTVEEVASKVGCGVAHARLVLQKQNRLIQCRPVLSLGRAKYDWWPLDDPRWQRYSNREIAKLVSRLDDSGRFDCTPALVASHRSRWQIPSGEANRPGISSEEMAKN
jgi:hypothetical protein